MNNEVHKILKQAHGNVLGIGLDEKCVAIIEQNDNITECNLLNSYSKATASSGKKKGKTITIKKIRKYFKKKKVDIIMCYYEEINKYLNSFVKDSIYINKETLCFFGNLDKEEIAKRYNRYETVINFKDYKDGSIVIIDNSKAKNNRLKEVFYSIIDTIHKIIIFIGDILMN